VQFCWLARLQSCVQEVRSCNAWWMISMNFLIPDCY
jgi:hypothetical protein